MAKRQFLCNKTLKMSLERPITEEEDAIEIVELEESIVFHIGRLYEEWGDGMSMSYDPTSVCIIDELGDGHWIGERNDGWLKHFMEITD